MCLHHQSTGVLPPEVTDPAALMPLPQPHPDELTRSASARKRLWELAHKYHCPVIGTCLTVAELKDIARRAGAIPRGRPNDYETHVSFVAAADSKNGLSVATQKALDRKHAAALKRFSRAKTAAEVLALWQEALATGQVPGGFWSLMTHPAADTDLRVRAYEDVHMLSHQVGAGVVADTKSLTDARAELARLRREAEAEAARNARGHAEKDARIAALTERNAALVADSRALAEARARIGALESDAELARLRERVAALEAELADCMQRAARADGEARTLHWRLDAAEAREQALGVRLADRDAACQALEGLLLDATDSHGDGDGDADGDAGGDDDCDGDCANCPCSRRRPDLGGRRVLCVGGRGSLARHYRQLVERCNGVLVRHDGGLEDSRGRLESLLASADAVICPADNVSHDAYLRTKRFCKRVGKPCVLIDRSSLGAFAKGLVDLVAAADAAAAPGIAVAEPTLSGLAAVPA